MRDRPQSTEDEWPFEVTRVFGNLSKKGRVCLNLVCDDFS